MRIDLLIVAVPVDDGYVEFEVIGADNYINEKFHIRGANSTSVDAVMVGKKAPDQTFSSSSK